MGDAFHISRILIQFFKMTVFFVICTYSELSGSMSHVFSFLHVYVFFSVTKMPLFGLQACVGNYQKITNTNAAANNPPIYNKTKAATIFIIQYKSQFFSQKNKDKYNEVTYLLPHFPLPHFQSPR